MAVRDKSLLLTEFVDWLRENDYAIFQKNPTVAEETLEALKGKDPEELLTDTAGDRYPEYIPSFKPFEQLFADFFDIDLKKAEEERRGMLEELRKDGR